MIKVTRRQLVSEGFKIDGERFTKNHPNDEQYTIKSRDFIKKLRDKLFVMVTFTYNLMSDKWILTEVNVDLIQGQEYTSIMADSWEQVKQVIEVLSKTKQS